MGSPKQLGEKETANRRFVDSILYPAVEAYTLLRRL
jgi:hypothetical protein